MRVLAGVGGAPILGLLIDIGALVSLFAGTLACITAAARVLLLMSHHGLAHGSLQGHACQARDPGPRDSRHRNCGRGAGSGSGGPRRERLGRLRLARFTGYLRLHRHLRPGFLRPAEVPARARRFQHRRACRCLARLAPRCCSLWSAIFILCPKAPTGNCPTSILDI